MSSSITRGVSAIFSLHSINVLGPAQRHEQAPHEGQESVVNEDDVAGEGRRPHVADLARRHGASVDGVGRAPYFRADIVPTIGVLGGHAAGLGPFAGAEGHDSSPDL